MWIIWGRIYCKLGCDEHFWPEEPVLPAIPRSWTMLSASTEGTPHCWERDLRFTVSLFPSGQSVSQVWLSITDGWTNIKLIPELMDPWDTQFPPRGGSWCTLQLAIPTHYLFGVHHRVYTRTFCGSVSMKKSQKILCKVGGSPANHPDCQLLMPAPLI